MALIAGLAALLLFRMDWPRVADMVMHLHPLSWLAALSVMAAQIFILAWRWKILCCDHAMTFPRSLNATLAALLSNLLLITSVSGVFVRIGLSVQHGISWVKASCAAIVDRLMTLFALVLLAAVLMPGLGQFVDPQLYRTAAITLSVFVGIVVVLIPLFFGQKLQSFLSGNDKIAAVNDYIRVFLTNPSQILSTVVASLIAQILYFVSVFIIARATGAEITFPQLLTVLPVIALVASLPLSVGGWGIREGAFIYGLGLLGVPMEVAFLISVQIGLLSMLAVVVTAIPTLSLSAAGRSFLFKRRRLVPSVNYQR